MKTFIKKILTELDLDSPSLNYYTHRVHFLKKDALVNWHHFLYCTLFRISSGDINGEDRDEDVEYLLSRYILSGRGVVLDLACILQTFIS